MLSLFIYFVESYSVLGEAFFFLAELELWIACHQFETNFYPNCLSQLPEFS